MEANTTSSSSGISSFATNFDNPITVPTHEDTSQRNPYGLYRRGTNVLGKCPEGCCDGHTCCTPFGYNCMRYYEDKFVGRWCTHTLKGTRVIFYKCEYRVMLRVKTESEERIMLYDSGWKVANKEGGVTFNREIVPNVVYYPDAYIVLESRPLKQQNPNPKTEQQNPDSTTEQQNPDSTTEHNESPNPNPVEERK